MRSLWKWLRTAQASRSDRDHRRRSRSRRRTIELLDRREMMSISPLAPIQPNAATATGAGILSQGQIVQVPWDGVSGRTYVYNNVALGHQWLATRYHNTFPITGLAPGDRVSDGCLLPSGRRAFDEASDRGCLSQG